MLINPYNLSLFLGWFNVSNSANFYFIKNYAKLTPSYGFGLHNDYDSINIFSKISILDTILDAKMIIEAVNATGLINQYVGYKTLYLQATKNKIDRYNLRRQNGIMKTYNICDREFGIEEIAECQDYEQNIVLFDSKY